MSSSYHIRSLRKVYSFSTAEIQHIYTGCHLSKDFMMIRRRWNPKTSNKSCEPKITRLNDTLSIGKL